MIMPKKILLIILWLFEEIVNYTIIEKLTNCCYLWEIEEKEKNSSSRINANFLKQRNTIRAGMVSINPRIDIDFVYKKHAGFTTCFPAYITGESWRNGNRHQCVIRRRGTAIEITIGVCDETPHARSSPIFSNLSFLKKGLYQSVYVTGWRGR